MGDVYRHWVTVYRVMVAGLPGNGKRFTRHLLLDNGLPGMGYRFTGWWVTRYRVLGDELPGNG